MRDVSETIAQGSILAKQKTERMNHKKTRLTV